MIYAAYGLVFGLFIPYLARRFSKFMPATPAYALYRILKPVRSVSCAKRAGNPEYRRLMTRYRMRSIGWGIVAAAISYLAAERFSDIYIVWYLGLIWTLLLLTEIDNRMMLLPDILTVPLLIAGFAYSVFVSQWVIPAESVLGAVTGYMLPVVASAFLVWKNKDAFGGGDIKLLAALGAWLGMELVIYTMILASVLFVLYALARRMRVGAFGPAITIAAIMIAFYFF
ncbi:MAG: prepilin peptidase [Alphaproteobacteria bacterium]|jgi:putative type IV prepilin leader peptidase|uniref:prepilin peptidase n=1 Tax=Candidatus Scatocola faecigallinarum TaxID=2840916 RepID=UPI00033FA5F0|nr:putative type IV prepilin leader peptidase [Azospirillum sp. CAG:239]